MGIHTHIYTCAINNSAFLLFECLATFSLTTTSSKIVKLVKLSMEI